MITFQGGPASGLTLELQRAPMFLRVVHNGKTFDALDQLDDKPEPGETIFTYKIIGQPGYAFIDGRDKKTGERFGRKTAIAKYEFYYTQPSDEIMLDNDKWGAWATETGMKILQESGGGQNGKA